MNLIEQCFSFQALAFCGFKQDTHKSPSLVLPLLLCDQTLTSFTELRYHLGKLEKRDTRKVGQWEEQKHVKYAVWCWSLGEHLS